MYINNSTQNIFLGGGPTAPQFGSGCPCSGGGMDPSQMLGSMQMMAASVMGMGFMGGGGMMPGGFSPGMMPNFGGVGGIGGMGGAGGSKQLAKAIKGLTKFLGQQAKMGKKHGKKKMKKG
ncbi:MAG: hypothetical protein KC800_20555 [Candidatus Eremiobacteraeota bacterium]|nr:hypothetical protein [Candidatus Eremiobacteraeota bacterium]